MTKVNPQIDLIYLIKSIDKELAKDFDKRLEEHELTNQQGRLLFYINRIVNIENGVIHQNDIEKMFKLSKSTVSGLVDRLEAKELIKRTSAHPYVEIVPTHKGESIVDSIFETRLVVIDKLLTNFSDDERNDVQKLLLKMYENIKEVKEC